MSRDQQRLNDYITHILQAIERIHRYTEDIDVSRFLQNDMLQDAVIRNIEIIGEAARNITRHYPEFAQEHAEIPWEDVYLMRNRVSHGFFRWIWRSSGRPCSAISLNCANG